jgi:hypothetical protein
MLPRPICSVNSYEVRISDDSRATVAIAQLHEGRIVNRNVKPGTLVLTCLMSYSATIPTPSSPGYQFDAVEMSAPDESLKATLVKTDAVRRGKVPELYVSFCPSC